MKKLFILLFDQSETDGSENIDSFLYVGSTWSSWFTGDKQGILPLFFCVSKLLYQQFFDWNRCVDIGFEGKTWKSVHNSFFH